MKSKKNLRTRLVFLYTGSFLVSIAPLIIMLALNWKDYTKTPGDTVKLCVGGVLCLFFIFCKVVEKLRMPRGIVLFGIVFVMSYLLKALLDDLMLLSGMALVGELLDLICFRHFIKVTKENILIEKSADATTSKFEEVLTKYLGNGRV